MKTPNNEAGRLTEEHMGEWSRRNPQATTHEYNRMYEKIYDAFKLETARQALTGGQAAPSTEAKRLDIGQVIAAKEKENAYVEEMQEAAMQNQKDAEYAAMRRREKTNALRPRRQATEARAKKARQKKKQARKSRQRNR